MFTGTQFNNQVPMEQRATRDRSPGSRAGFSLIEIMIVIAIAGVMLAMGIPSILRAIKRSDLTTAAQNVMEGCAYAREMAIFKGIPHDFVINADRSLTIEAAPNWDPISSPNPSTSFDGSAPVRRGGTPSAAAAGFRRTLTDTIYVDALAVNFVDMDQTDTDKVRVRFHPNGTSDEFTIVLNGVEEGMRKITLDIVTGKPMLESPR